MTMQDWQQEFQLYFLERRALIISVVCALVAILIWPLAIVPLWGQMSTSQSRAKTLSTQVTQTTSRATLLQSLDEQQREAFRRAEAALPLQKQPFAALLGINEIASRSGVALNSYDLSPGVVSTNSGEAENTRASAGGIQTFPIDVSFQGTIDQIQEAFRLLESNLPLFEIVEFSVSPQGDATSEAALVRSEVTVRMYSAPLQASEFARSTASTLTDKQLSVMERLLQYNLSEPADFLPEGGLRFNNQEYLGE